MENRRGKYSRTNKCKRNVKFRTICSYDCTNYYTLIIFVFLSNINLFNANAKCIAPLLLLHTY